MKKTRMPQRLLSLVLVLMMLISGLPVSAMAAASSRAVILVIFMDLLPSYNKKYRCIFKTTTVLYQILW